MEQNDLFSCLVNWSSIISLILASSTFILLINIRGKFLFRSNVKNYKKDLLEISNNMNILLNNFQKNINDINEKIASADVKLRTIEKYAKNNLLNDVKKTRNKIKVYNQEKLFFVKQKNYRTEAVAREIKLLIVTIINELDIVKKEITVGVQ
jgi:hypothetical protein